MKSIKDREMELVANAKYWKKKISTWLAATVGTALFTYALLPERIKEAFPDWFLWGLGAVVMFGIPTAVQIRQPKIEVTPAAEEAKADESNQ